MVIRVHLEWVSLNILSWKDLEVPLKYTVRKFPSPRYSLPSAGQGVCLLREDEEQIWLKKDKKKIGFELFVVFGFQRCAYCKHLGATIKCCEEKCTQMYHYPCAAGAGTFQDFSNLSLLCPDHIDQAPERCKYTVFK